MKIFVASDIHGDIKKCEDVIAKFYEEKADRLLLLGDILYHGPRNDLPSDYEGNALDNERIEAQLKKTGDTPFIVDNVFFLSDAPIKCKISLLNELRRGALDALLMDIDSLYERDTFMSSYDMFESGSDSDKENGSDLKLHVFPSFKRAEGDMSRDCDMYAFSYYDLSVPGFYNKIKAFIEEEDSKLVVLMPDFCHDSVIKPLDKLFEKIKGDLDDRFVAVIDSLGFSNHDIYEKYGLKHYLSCASNAFNSRTISSLAKEADAVSLSYEIMPSESIEILKKSDVDTILVHTEGMIPWMQSHFCPIGAHKEGCRSCYDPVTYKLKGDSDKECIVISRPMDCSSVIYGPSKYQFDDETIEEINGLGINTISVSVEL